MASKSQSASREVKELQYERIVQAISREDADELSQVYDRLSLPQTPNKIDINLVHALNEFQAVYYYTGALCEIKSLRLKFLSPSRFYNANFLLRFVSSKQQNDTNNNVIDESQLKDVQLIEEKTQKYMDLLNKIYEPIRDHVAKMNLDELLTNS